MSVCTFFGHRDSPIELRPKLIQAISTLIEKHAVDTFLVGNSGRFDSMVLSVLKELSIAYPHIRFSVILSYMPTSSTSDLSYTLLPEGIETVPKKFAITWRNNWMIDHSDYVISYVTHSFGGAAKFTEAAKRKNKTVIELQRPHK
ncbi:MAG: hypothetical protein IJF16_07140 [Clostridia bacterium]|nr:hypothetical protein [Clostridia bacterium]